MAKRLASDDDVEFEQDELLPSSKREPPKDSFPLLLSRAGRERYGELLNFDMGNSCKGYHVIITCKLCYWHPPAGAVSRTRVVVQEDGHYYFQVLLLTKEEGTITSTDHFLSLCEMMANGNNDYKFCPGIDPETYENDYFSKIRKNVCQFECPFKRIDSCNCQLFHKLAKNASIIEKGLECVPCSACKRLISDLNQRIKTAVTSPARVKRQNPSSNCPLKYMSPRSQKKRKDFTQRQRARDKKKLQKYAHTELTLDDEQHDELSQIVEAIDDGEVKNWKK